MDMDTMDSRSGIMALDATIDIVETMEIMDIMDRIEVTKSAQTTKMVNVYRVNLWRTL